MMDICMQMGLDTNEILSLTEEILHGELEDSAEIIKSLDDDKSPIRCAVAKVEDLKSKSANIEDENLRALIMSEVGDMKLIMTLISFHVAVMRSIRDIENTELKKKEAEEAGYLWAHIAHQLGLYNLKRELEDLSLKYLEHDAYYHIKDKLNATKESRDKYITRFIESVEKKLMEAGLRFHMKGRTKSIHSIWQKMKKQHVGVDGVYDLFAIRIILNSPREKEKQDCWQVFSIITDMYQSNPKRMRDWLSVPKDNGYESLHITVLGPEEKWVEVQIRTERMDDIAEHGLAAHWRYKGVKEAKDDGIFVFTPKGDLHKLTTGSTILDFAYHIHTGLGNRCTGARIGGKVVSIKHVLQSGDQVEIMTSSTQTPKQDWLNIATSSKAKAKIRQSLKEMQFRQALMAKEVLERKMKNRKLEYDEPTLMHTITELGFKVVTDFYEALAQNRIDINTVLEDYSARLNPITKPDAGSLLTEKSKATDFVLNTPGANELAHHSDDVLVIDRTLKGIDFQMARCCQPVYGDEVFGFVTSGGGIKIHRTACPNAKQLRERFGYRIVRAEWAGKGGSQYPITLRIIGNDDLGIVNNITSIISKEEKILLRSISIDSVDGLFSGTLTVMLDDAGRLNQLIRKLKTVKGVKNVTRS
ncbi:MAG: bifunctional (p)ppGpp synthetase/guanosine-3',5'-bis(diphosphate) 3'-pyrophosphohydrolase [Bacteroidaceae bacterium]|nr:bifunctional (p)ppGpp synthetase/guanosine-3',5'-bis(diphosphate) 3'-pyrophosphohydrolase [Bacteroidaceae bacterium]